MNVVPRPPAGSSLEPKHYYTPVSQLPSEKTSNMKYAAILEQSYQDSTWADSYGASTVKYETIKYFDTEKELKEWYSANMLAQYGACKVVRIIRYEELQVKTQLEVTLA